LFQEGEFTKVNSDQYDYVEPFEKIKSSGGWPDIIEKEFECTFVKTLCPICR